MEVKELIKNIRNENKYTQEDLAKELNVTRQAISNWETGKNIPDIEILIKISERFNISLDTMIKGEKNIKDKIIYDGSTTKKARYNMILSIVALILMMLGIICLMIKGFSVEYIDNNGILHENFFLLPVGFVMIFSSLLIYFGIFISKIKENKINIKY